jgi:hypothetical protein
MVRATVRSVYDFSEPETYIRFHSLSDSIGHICVRISSDPTLTYVPRFP